MMMTRRSLLAATVFGAVSVVAAVPSACAEGAKINFQLAWLPNAAAAGEIVALKNGYFDQKGLQVTILSGGPGTNAVQEILAGTATVAHGYAPQLMYAANKGLPIKSFAASFQKAPLTFYSLGEANIKSIEDWKGKVIGISPGAEPQVHAILNHAGLEMSDVTLVQAQTPALMQGQVDAVASWPTNVSDIVPIISHPGGYNTQSIWDNGLQFQSNYYMANQETLRKDRKMLVNFLEAVDLGWKYAAEHPTDTIEMVASMAEGLDKKKELASLEAILSGGYIYNEETLEHGFGNIDSDRWRRTLELYQKIGEIGPGVTVDSVFDDRVLKAADRTKR